MLKNFRMANGFSYWQYQPLSNATKTYFDDMAQALGHVQSVTGSLDGVHFMNGGTDTLTLSSSTRTNMYSRNRLAR